MRGNIADAERAKKYGKRLRYDLMPVRYLQKVEKSEDGLINYYAGEFWHKEFSEAIKVVIIVKIDVKKQKLGHAPGVQQ